MSLENPESNQPIGLWGELEDSIEKLREYYEGHRSDMDPIAAEALRAEAYHPRPDKTEEAQELLAKLKKTIEELGL